MTRKVSLEIVENRIHELFDNVLCLRSESLSERLGILGDSFADLSVIQAFVEAAIIRGIDVVVLYYRTNLDDDMEQAHDVLDLLEQNNVQVRYFDSIQDVPNSIEIAVNEFVRMNASVVISNLSDDYDLRSGISSVARQRLIPILEVPTLDMKAFTSNMFNTNVSTMKNYGNEIITILKSFERFRVVSSDGSDLAITLNPDWINEAENTYNTRSWDYEEIRNNNLPQPSQDNPPGELFTNVRSADGSLALYQFDNCIIKFAYRNASEYKYSLHDSDYITYIYDSSDPVMLKIREGFIDIDSIDESSLRGKIFKDYLTQKIIEDNSYSSGFVKHPRAACHVAEWAIGINSGAKNPEEEIVDGICIDSVLITEKALGVWHIAFGNTPCSDMAEYTIRSSTHIDCGIRNPDLKVFGLNQDSSPVLLTSNSFGQNGVVDEILQSLKQKS
jgi:hypothetical protein